MIVNKTSQSLSLSQAPPYPTPPPCPPTQSWQSLLKATTHAEARSSHHLYFVGLVNSQTATIRTPPRSSPALGPWGIASSPRTLEAVAAAKNTQNLSIKRLRINTPHTTHTRTHTHTGHKVRGLAKFLKVSKSAPSIFTLQVAK